MLYLIVPAQHVVQLKNKAAFNVTDFQVVSVFLLFFLQLTKRCCLVYSKESTNKIKVNK